MNRADQTTNTSASADVNSQPDPNHPQNPAHTAGEDGQGHIPSHTRGAVGANKDGIAGGGNPLKPGAAGRGFHTSARVGASSKPVEEQSAQHPGKSDIDHLENPSLSEEVGALFSLFLSSPRTATDPLFSPCLPFPFVRRPVPTCSFLFVLICPDPLFPSSPLLPTFPFLPSSSLQSTPTAPPPTPFRRTRRLPPALARRPSAQRTASRRRLTRPAPLLTTSLDRPAQP